MCCVIQQLLADLPIKRLKFAAIGAVVFLLLWMLSELIAIASSATYSVALRLIPAAMLKRFRSVLTGLIRSTVSLG